MIDLECVINVSEGRSAALVDEIAGAAGHCLLDVHRDPWHHRSVLTLAGPEVLAAAREVARVAVELLDLRDHVGAHPRLGVVDVVPFVPLGPLGPLGPAPHPPAAAQADLEGAIDAREAFARFAAADLGVPCFCYGPERSLPEIRRRAFVTEAPDHGPPSPHPTAGAICVGARRALVAYNLWLAEPDLELAQSIAAAIRGPAVRALGLDVGGHAQVSCNLVDPLRCTPAEVFDLVAARARIERAELVGLLPTEVLERVPERRWPELDLSSAQTIEARRRARAGP